MKCRIVGTSAGVANRIASLLGVLSEGDVMMGSRVAGRGTRRESGRRCADGAPRPPRYDPWDGGDRVRWLRRQDERRPGGVPALRGAPRRDRAAQAVG